MNAPPSETDLLRGSPAASVDAVTDRRGAPLVASVRQVSGLLVAAAAVILVFSLYDWWVLGRYSGRMLAVRLVWAALVLSVAGALPRASPSGRTAWLVALGAASSGLFWVLVVASGGYPSPHFHWILTVPIVFALLAQHEVEAIVAACAVSIASGVVTLWMASEPAIIVAEWTVQAVALTGLAVYSAVTCRALLRSTDALRSVRTAALAERQAQAALRESKEQLEIVLEGVGEAITAYSPDGRLVFANDVAVRALGVADMDALLGTEPADIASTFELTTEDGRPLPPEELPPSRALRGGRAAELVIRHRRRGDREWGFARVGSTPVVHDGEIRMVITIWRDITGPRREEEARRFLADVTALLAESLDEEAILSRLAQALVPRLAEIAVAHAVGPDAEVHVAVAGADASDAPLLDRAEPEPRSGSASRRVLETGQPLYVPEIDDAALHAFAPDARDYERLKKLDLGASVAVPLTIDGRALGALELFFRRSEGLRADRELRLVEELGRRAALALEKARLYREARDAVRARDEFVTIPSHELRTPLTALALQLDLLRREPLAHQSPAREKLRRADRQVQRLTRLVDQLLDLSVIATGQTVLSPEPLDLASLVRDVTTQLSDSARLAGSALTVSTEPARGCWDRRRVAQVLQNLVENAIKYGRGLPIDVAVRRADETALVSVTDRGIGIAPEKLDRIFGKFERAVSVRHYGGLGLGLFIARQLVEAMGGSIGVRSVMGQGCTFEVRLPIRQTPCESPAAVA